MERETHYENVLIIGAGPAGLAAGIELSLAGIDCCILERAALPKCKICGGLLTPKAKELYEYLLDDAVDISCLESIIINYQGKRICKYPSKGYHIVNRSEFDYALIERFTGNGGRIVEECPVTYISRRQKHVVTKKGIFHYQKLILANGGVVIASDQAQRPLNKQNRYIGLSCITRKDTCKSAAIDSIEVSFDTILVGYSWRFPINNSQTNIGFATAYKSSAELKKYINSIESEFCHNGEKLYGLYLPIYLNKSLATLRNQVERDVYYAGEAGGYIDTLTGEGLFFALYTGICAGKLLSKEITQEEYLHYIKHIERIIKSSSFTRNLLWGRAKLLPAIIKISKFTKRLDSHITNNLFLNYRYNYYTAFLSPFICFLGIPLPFDCQKKLMRLILKSRGVKNVQTKEQAKTISGI